MSEIKEFKSFPTLAQTIAKKETESFLKQLSNNHFNLMEVVVAISSKINETYMGLHFSYKIIESYMHRHYVVVRDANNIRYFNPQQKTN